LNRALTKVQVYGWTDRAISAAIEELGFSSSLVGLFIRGPYDLVDYFMRVANHNSLTKLSKLPLNEMTLKEKLETALRLRLEEIIPYASNWPQAMALGATPAHLKDTIERIYLYIDDVLYVCGDKSTNLQWYTHRGSLFSVYVAAEVYMSTDRSVNYAATWNFLHQRMENIADFHVIGNTSFQMAEQVATFICNVACSTLSVIDPRRR
jgi:ubiquinone biosynthesis protein COQ9